MVQEVQEFFIKKYYVIVSSLINIIMYEYVI